MAYFCSNFDSNDVEEMQAAEVTNSKEAAEAFDEMFEDSNKALDRLFRDTFGGML